MSTSVEATPLSGLTAADVMSPGLLSCEPDAPLREVATIMAVNQVHAVALRDGSGVVTALDVAASPAAATAAGVARAPATIFPGDTLVATARAIAEGERSHVFVLDPSSTLFVGIVSTFDVAAVLAGRDPRTARGVRPRPARPAISTSSLGRVTAGEAMHLGVFGCPRGTALRELAAALVDHRVHMLMVDGAAVDDIAIVRAAATGADPLHARIETIDAAQTLEAASAAMARTGSSHLLVARDERPVGVLSAFDIVDVLAVG